MGSSSTSWASESNTHAGSSKAYDSTSWSLYTTTSGLRISAAEGQTAQLELWADEGDDYADKWLIDVADGGSMTWQNYTSGSYATKLTLSTAGALTVPGATQLNSTLTVGVDNTGYDVKFYGDTATNGYMLWDQSTDDLILGSSSRLGIGTTAPTQALSVETTHVTSASFGKEEDAPHYIDVVTGNFQGGYAGITFSQNRSVTSSAANNFGMIRGRIVSGDAASTITGALELLYNSGDDLDIGLSISETGEVNVEDGNLIITQAAKGIIHTGSGTVTQGTSITTGVTLNTTSGVITMHATAIAADENIEFTVTNSTVQADSVILLSMQDENTVDNTQLVCATHTIGGGSFKITVANTDSGQASSATAVKIHFLVINNS